MWPLNDGEGALVSEGTEQTPSLRILVVCSANVCRSPVAAAMLNADFATLDLDSMVTVVSRGVSAMEGDQVCADAVALAGVSSFQHAAKRLTADDIAAADLILTAEELHRGAVVRLVPAARRRTFTMLEAVSLGQWLALGSPLPEGFPLPKSPPPTDSPRARLLWWVSELNESRGLPALGGEIATNIHDAHELGRIDHHTVVSQVRAATTFLATTIGAMAR